MRAPESKQLLALLAQADELRELGQEAEAMVASTPPVQVGFIGEFNAGKSTLINALIGGSYLPVSDQPTTGEITVIEAANGLDKVAFHAQEGASRRAISALKFSDLALQGGDAIPVLVVPASKRLPEGVRLIDTPGLQSLRTLDAATTVAFTAYLDAVVVCIDINRGGLSASLVKFLKQPWLRALRSDISVALCKADHKSARAQDEVRSSTLACLRELLTDDEWSRIRPEDRVITVAAGAQTGDAGVERVWSLMHDVVYARHAELTARRRLSNLGTLATRAQHLMEDLRENLKLDDKTLREKERETEVAIGELRKHRARAEEKVDLLQYRLTQILHGVSGQYASRLVQSDASARSAVGSALMKELHSAVQAAIRQYIGEIGVPPIGAGTAELEARMSKLYQMRDLAVQVATAVAAAALSGGTSVAANAAEATAGAGAQAAGKAASKTAAKTGANKLLGHFLGAVGDLVRDINPLEQVGDLIAGSMAENAVRLELDKIASSVSSATVQFVREVYLDKELAEAEAQLRLKAKLLRGAQSEREDAERDLELRRTRLSNLADSFRDFAERASRA